MFNIKITEDNKPIFKKHAKNLNELEDSLDEIDLKMGFGGKKNRR